MVKEAESRHIFREGDHALMVDRRGRKYLVRLSPGKLFETHIGNVPHDELIGLEYGARVTTSRGHRMLAVKPTMAEFVLDMPRIATVNYPKDIGAILVHGDIFPGARVLEAGSGSGGMTIALARAVGESGRVISYDVREDMIARARENLAAIVPNADWVTFKLGDVYQGFDESDIDRVFLDLAEPWQIVSNVSESLSPGGILISFLPSITQVHDLTKALRAQRTFEMIETFEIMMRSWNISGRSVRPSHRMVGHTGFITTARKFTPRPFSPDEDEPSPTQEE